jgi:transposase
LLDRARWHTTANLDIPGNITPIFLPSRAPELNPVENVWQFLRGIGLSNRVFDTYDDIIDAACDAWRIHRSARNHHLNRHARLGTHRSHP